MVGNNVSLYARRKRTYQPAVGWHGVGGLVANNTISDAPHVGILGGGNEYMFEGNTLEHLGYEGTALHKPARACTCTCTSLTALLLFHSRRLRGVLHRPEVAAAWECCPWRHLPQNSDSGRGQPPGIAPGGGEAPERQAGP